MVNSIFNGWRMEDSGSTNSAFGPCQRFALGSSFPNYTFHRPVPARLIEDARQPFPENLLVNRTPSR